ncbi:hypothetical protein DZF91_07575 [Actinomadura logoneensis]|uniref:Uncharacterized protein n=1 Tax=Actinomadura logoneensis TaxID=2293572 RepID=A0A372JR36_9ACTN|nr:hypothetical protein DZF91_07575 [Actinomadura logoneensis]
MLIVMSMYGAKVVRPPGGGGVPPPSVVLPLTGAVLSLVQLCCIGIVLTQTIAVDVRLRRIACGPVRICWGSLLS